MVHNSTSKALLLDPALLDRLDAVA